MCATRALDLVKKLGEAVKQFAVREAELERTFRARAYSEEKQHQELAESQEGWKLAREREMEDYYQREKERVRENYSKRSEKILNAYHASKRGLPKKVEDWKGRWVGRIQMEKFRADREYEEAIASAEQEFAEVQERLKGEGEGLLDLESSVRAAFRGYPGFRKALKPAPANGGGDAPDTRGDLGVLDEITRLRGEAGEKFGEFGRFLIPKFFRFLPPWLIFALLLAGGVALVFKLGQTLVAYGVSGGVLFFFLGVFFCIHRVGKGRSGAVAGEVAAAVRAGRELYEATQSGAAERHEHHMEKRKEGYEAFCADLSSQWGEADVQAIEMQERGEVKIERQLPRISEKNEQMFTDRFNRLMEEHPEVAGKIRSENETEQQQLTETSASVEARRKVEYEEQWGELVSDWNVVTRPLYEEIGELRDKLRGKFPEWESTFFQQWQPVEKASHGATFGSLAVDVEKMSDGLPEDPRLALPGEPRLDVPLALSLPDHGSLLFENESTGAGVASDVLNTVIFRLLGTTPPGKLNLTIIDPVGMGQGFAGLMHLADYEDSLIGGRIWTGREQIEEKLAQLNEHMEKIIQMYLRNEYATITEYNKQAGNIAEKYHFLVVSDFPAAFSDPAAQRLLSIAASGARCGIYTLVHWDKRQPLPDGFDPEELRKSSIRIVGEKGMLSVAGSPEQGVELVLDPPLNGDAAVDFVHRVGKSSTDSNRVEVPFEHIAPAAADYWTNETTHELRVPIGRTGATKLQYLAVGKGTRQHALIAGKTGSGKSTLFHVMVTNLALSCSPDEVEFYLIDFKKGVEFKCYATKQLPHARVVAIESDREFGLSVLQRVDEELRRRGDRFRKLGVQDIAGYMSAGGDDPVPRSLLMIDEFQEFFVEDDRIAQSASVLLDRIVRQGRAFGIHVILGSQTLGGAYSLARTTLGQMVVRIALQCNEADAYLIMDDSNPAPRLLSRPGEGIYNDAAGSVEGNSPFQAVWLSEEERDRRLDEVNALAEKSDRDYGGPIVFEGNSPASVRENPLLRKQLSEASEKAPPIARLWMGAPNSIKGPTEAAFRQQSGSNLLIVGQREEAALAITGIGLISLAAQHPVAAAEFIFLDAAVSGTTEGDFLERVIAAVPHGVRSVKNHDVPTLMADLDAEMKRRGEDGGASSPPIFLFVHDLAKYKKLRQEDDFSFSLDDDAAASPAAQFEQLITEGASLGIHIIATVDTYNNVSRFMSRKALSEFEMRVVFQMSANDSASLIDSPDAGGLGLHRALYYNEHEGTLETFRPYALPDYSWLDEIREQLSGLGATSPLR